MALSLPSVASRPDYSSSGEFGQTAQGRGCMERSEDSVKRHSPNKKHSTLSRQPATASLCAQDGRDPLICPLPCALLHGGGLGRGPATHFSRSRSPHPRSQSLPLSARTTRTSTHRSYGRPLNPAQSSISLATLTALRGGAKPFGPLGFIVIRASPSGWLPVGRLPS